MKLRIGDAREPASETMHQTGLAPATAWAKFMLPPKAASKLHGRHRSGVKQKPVTHVLCAISYLLKITSGTLCQWGSAENLLPPRGRSDAVVVAMPCLIMHVYGGLDKDEGGSVVQMPCESI
eukprot:1672458-Amphidinium_carterae.1